MTMTKELKKLKKKFGKDLTIVKAQRKKSLLGWTRKDWYLQGKVKGDLFSGRFISHSAIARKKIRRFTPQRVRITIENIRTTWDL